MKDPLPAKSILPVTRAGPRFRPWHLALAVLIVGWGPSLAVAYLSFDTLSRTLDDKTTADARSLAGSLARYVEDSLVRTGETVDYYRTLPGTAALLQTHGAPPVAAPVPAPAPAGRGGTANPTVARALPVGPPSRVAGATAAAMPAASAQEWLTNIFYAQRRVDGFFLTDRDGHLLAAVPPPDPGLLQRPYAVEHWRVGADAILPAEPTAEARAGFSISPVYARPTDGRPVTSAVAPVRDNAGTVLGYLGADTLVERMGVRLATHSPPGRTAITPQLIDSRGRPLFTTQLGANTNNDVTLPPILLSATRRQQVGQVETDGRAFFFAPLERAGWTAVLEESAAVVHQPVHDMRAQTLLMVGWLVAGCALAAYGLAALYRRQLNLSLLAQREQVFSENILANLPVGIALVDAFTGRFQQANESFNVILRSLGMIREGETAVGEEFAASPLATPRTLGRVLKGGVPFRAVEERREPGTNRRRYLNLHLLRLQDASSRVLGILCLVEDATEDYALRHELIEANAAKDQFFAQLSHELRTPLTPVVTMVAELERYVAEQNGTADPGARHALEVIRRNVQLEARLIDDLLDLTRIRSGKLQLNREATDVHRALRLALEIVWQDLQDKELTVDLHLDAREHFADADPARLQQVFWNLIKNAVKFTPRGRRLTLRTDNAPAETSPDGAPALPPRLRAEVADEGIGIAPDHLARIFNAFEQGGSATTKQFGGLGLGLAISRSLVEAHGGQLRAHSDGPNLGATFTLELDTVPAPAITPPPTSVPVNTPAIANPRPAGARILLVDDHHDTCLGMKLLLRRRGHDVTIGHSVADGVAAAEGAEPPFDLLISDLGLPDGSGCDLMETLRKRADGGPPGIALSGYGMESDLARTAEAGFQEHLVKPVNFERLDAAIARLLAKPTAAP